MSCDIIRGLPPQGVFFMENKKISITLPYPTFIGEAQSFYNQAKKAVYAFLNEISSQINQGYSTFQSTRQKRLNPLSNFKNPFNNFKGFKFPRFPKKIMLVLPIVLIAVVAGIIWKTASSLNGNVKGVNDNNLTIQKALKEKNLNREFSYPLKDANNKEVGKFKYILESAEIRNEIIVKGQKATAVKGRTFLIVNIKLVNDLKSGININSRDYVRLIVNKNEKELLAADVHNDPVEVQAISTRYTRLGFAINETDKNHTLLIGEIDGTKQKIELNF